MDIATARPQGIPETEHQTSEIFKPQGGYHTVQRLRRMYHDFLGAKDAEIKEARTARHYYHGSQWTEDELKVLAKRKQPAVTSNRVVRKIDAIVGLVERLRQDPKAFPRTPQQEQGADLATAVLRYALDNNDWKSKSARIARFCAVDGIAGIEYNLKNGDHGDPDLEMHIVTQDCFFYDPRSFDEGFTDARYVGVAKWVDLDLAQEMFPDKAEDIAGLIDQGSDLTTSADYDRLKIWLNSNERRIRLVDHWYVKGGQWKWSVYIANSILAEGISPFKDEIGQTFPKYRCFSASVDHDGDRYGFVRNLKSPQDEINHRRSKALHIINSNRLIAQKGSVDDIETTRKEWARPDGVIEVNPGLEVKPDDRSIDLKGQLELLQEAKNEIENFGPNPALIGQGLEDSSGRAISLLQQAGIAELGPYLSAWKNWKIRVYRDIWNIIQRAWTSERWIRVTDDQQVAQFLQINGVQIDPNTGVPVLVNALGSLDVDIIIDEAPDAVNMQADSFMVLQSLGPQFAQQFPDIALELSPLAHSVKKPMLDKIRQMQQQPPPNPQLQVAQLKAQADAQKTQAQAQIDMAKVQAQAQQAQVNAHVSQQQAAMDLELQARKHQMDMERMQAEAELRRQEVALKRIEMAMHQENMQRQNELKREQMEYQASQREMAGA